jgi:hypothetical protein
VGVALANEKLKGEGLDVTWKHFWVLDLKPQYPQNYNSALKHLIVQVHFYDD